MTDRAKSTTEVPTVRYTVGAQAMSTQMVKVKDLVRCPICGRNVHKDDLTQHCIVQHGVQP